MRKKKLHQSEFMLYIRNAMPLPPLPDFVPVMKVALVFYKSSLFQNTETSKPIPTITSTTFQSSLPNAILKNG